MTGKPFLAYRGNVLGRTARNTITYDGHGKRRRIEDSDGLRNIIWDGQNIALETDSGYSTVAAYTLAPEVHGALLAQRRSGATSFYHCDGLGSIRNLTNSAQTVTDTRDYKAFGVSNGSSGSTTNRFWWVGRFGHCHLPDSGDYLIGERWLLVRLGRGASGLPHLRQRGRSRYPYADNNPTDPARPLERAKAVPAGHCRRASDMGAARCNWTTGYVDIDIWDTTCTRSCTEVHEQVHQALSAEECMRMHKCYKHWASTPEDRKKCADADAAWRHAEAPYEECIAYLASSACLLSLWWEHCYPCPDACCLRVQYALQNDVAKAWQYCSEAPGSQPPIPFAEDGTPIETQPIA
jgi:hypothetical protein